MNMTPPDLFTPLRRRLHELSRTVAWLLCPALALLLFCFTGCQSPSDTNAQFPVESGASAAIATNLPATRLHEGDVIRVTFEADTNMNTVAKIQLEGTINLPLTGDIKAAGKTLDELKTELMSRYENLLKVKEISVALVSSSASVTVSGAVLKPGRIPMERPMTALEAIMEAGGYDPTRAKMTEVRVLRIENGQQKNYELNLKRAIQKGDASPFSLKPFDNVHVPEKRFNF